MSMSHRKTHIETAREYFDYLGERFPVMCASDEFHFLPRAESAARHYDKLDDLRPDAVFEALSALKTIKNALSAMRAPDDDLEKRLDIELLEANINGVLIEFEHNRTWRHNPLLYLKIAFIGLDHALDKPSGGPGETAERACARLSRVPRLLKQAADNIETVPEAYYRASLHMIDDCRRYLTDICKSPGRLPGADASRFRQLGRAAQEGLDSFRRLLKDLRPSPDRLFAGATLERTLTEHFLCARSLDEIFQIATESWMENLARLEELRKRIDPAGSWQRLYREYDPPCMERSDTLSLYAQEIESLRSFFARQGFDQRALGAALEISETPLYLRSVRGTASFAAAHTSDAAEKSYFYITTRLAHQSDEQEQKSLKKRFHREYRLLTAHEAIPGHHYLDAIRRQLHNPVRRQIESPLFYEGWASYAESLLAEYGYGQSLQERLVDSRRNLWRSARCQIDVGLFTGRINTAGACELLTTCGFTAAEARRQVDRFRLNPGYQLCYSLGKYEFARLHAAFATRLGKRRFYGHLLAGGELPFRSIHARLARICRGSNGD